MNELRIAIATPVTDHIVERIAATDERISVIYDPSLLPPKQHPGDHVGEPSFRRTAAQQKQFESLLGEADVWYGIPGNSSRLLSKTVPTSFSLRWVQTMAAGGGSQVEKARLSAADLERVTFTTSAGVHGGTLSEFALMGVLAGAKDLLHFQQGQQRRQWLPRKHVREVQEMTVLIVGLGGIGQSAAEKFSALGARVIGVKRTPGTVAHVEEVFAQSDLGLALGQADAVVFTLPSTAETKHLYSADLVARTKPGAIVVNVGRGDVIDQEALIGGLEDGPLHSAFLDVTDPEPLPPESRLWSMPQVAIVPHTAALSVHEDDRICELFCENAKKFLSRDPLRNVVDVNHFY